MHEPLLGTVVGGRLCSGCCRSPSPARWPASGHERSLTTVGSQESELVPRMALGATRATKVLICVNRKVLPPTLGAMPN